MNKEKIIENWKNADYRNQLREEDADIPDHPAGKLSLTDPDLSQIFGGIESPEAIDNTWAILTVGCCSTVVICPTGSYRIGTYGCCPE